MNCSNFIIMTFGYSLKNDGAYELKNSLSHILTVLDLEEVSSKEVTGFLPYLIGKIDYLDSRVRLPSIKDIPVSTILNVSCNSLRKRPLQETTIPKLRDRRE